MQTVYNAVKVGGEGHEEARIGIRVGNGRRGERVSRSRPGRGYVERRSSADGKGAREVRERDGWLAPRSARANLGVLRVAAAGASEFRPLATQRYGAGHCGTKGFGGSGIFPCGPNVGNALFGATGVRVRSLLPDPEQVWRALDQNARGDERESVRGVFPS